MSLYYVGSTKVFTLSTDWSIIPDSTSSIIIHVNSGLCPLQTITADTGKKIKLASTHSTGNIIQDNFFKYSYIKLLHGSGMGQFFKILSYDNSTQIATLNGIITELVCETTLYAVFGEGGTATAGAATSITLEAHSSHGHNVDITDYTGLCLQIIGGTGIGQTQTISSNSNLVMTVPTWTTTPDNTSEYIIFGGWSGDFEDCLKYTQVTSALVLANNETCIIDQQLGLTSTGSQARGKTSQNTSVLPSSVHTLVIVSNYFRLRLLSMGTTITGNLQTIFHTTKNKALTSFVGEPINAQNDCELTRSVLTGRLPNGTFGNANLSVNGNLLADIGEPRSAFGNLIIEENTPVAQISFPYDLEGIVIDLDYGTVIQTSQTGTGALPQVSVIYFPPGDQFTSSGAADYFFLYNGSNTQFYIWFDVGDGNSDPSPGGTGIEVNISLSDISTAVALAAQTAIDLNGGFSAVVTLANIITITNAANGVVTSAQPGTMPTTSGSAVTYDATNSMAQLDNSASIASWAVFRSSRSAKYRPGQGIEAKFTAVFTDSPVSGVSQLAGVGNQVGGLFFGYNGTSFGILHRSSGQPEVRTLTISSGASGSETASVTVDGITYSVGITSGTAAHNAYEIATSNTFSHGDWLIESVDSTIIFSSIKVPSATSRNLSYGFSSSTAAGTFVQTTPQVAITNEWIPQDKWNSHRMKGFGNIDMILDPSKGNVYKIVFQWLGFGRILFMIEDNITGEFVTVHHIRYANKFVVPSMSMPHLRLLFATYTETAAISKRLKSSSGALSIQGKIRKFNNVFNNSSSKTTTDGNETSIVTFRNMRIYKGKGNNTEVEMKIISIANDGGKAGTIKFYSNGTLGETDYQSVGADSCMTYDNTNTLVPTGGKLVASQQVAGGAVTQFEIEKLGIMIHNTETLTLTATRNTSTNVEITISSTWREDR